MQMNVGMEESRDNNLPNENQKLLFRIKPSDLGILGNMVFIMSKYSSEETQNIASVILEYIEGRDYKPYSFFTYDQIYIMWAMSKTYIEDKIAVHTDQEWMDRVAITIDLAKILDKPFGDGRVWRSFT